MGIKRAMSLTITKSRCGLTIEWDSERVHICDFYVVKIAQTDVAAWLEAGSRADCSVNEEAVACDEHIA